jgi:hypothetical protein
MRNNEWHTEDMESKKTYGILCSAELRINRTYMEATIESQRDLIQTIN